MKIHVCLYLKGDEIININEVFAIIFHDNHVVVRSFYCSFRYFYTEFDKIEVNYYD